VLWFTGTPQAADLEQFKSEFFDPGQHAVQRGLIRHAVQQRVAAMGIGVQGRERTQRRRAQVTANPDLVVHRRLLVALLAGHRLAARSDPRAVAILARESKHRAARSSEKASTAG
jgi:hypothetical protein